MSTKNTKKESRKTAVRIICLAMAGLLILSSIAAIFVLFN